jgi:putative ABC transport system ATP-binding protein
MIRLSGLSMHYDVGPARIDVLKNLDLRVAAGERVAISGPSGCGKTTLLLLLAGLEQPCAGSIALDGVGLGDLDRDQLADLRRDRVGIVFQSFHLVPSLTAIENVALPLEIAARPDARGQARALLEEVGLAGRAGHYPSQLSGGEQQRVAIARALVHSPSLLLADEPTGNLDDHTGRAVGDLLFDVTGRTRTTMIIVTHNLALASRCDRVLRLQDGKLSETAAQSAASAA